MAVRILEERIQQGNKRYIEAVGLSTDTKPTDNIVTGSLFVEVNTGKVFMHNEEGTGSSKWVEQFSLQG